MSWTHTPSVLGWVCSGRPEMSDLLIVCVCCSVSQLCQILLWSHELQQARLPCPSLSLGDCSKSCPLSQWYYITILSSVAPFSCPLSSQHQSLFQWVDTLHQIAKILERQHQSFQWIFRSRLTSPNVHAPFLKQSVLAWSCPDTAKGPSRPKQRGPNELMLYGHKTRG